MWLGYAFFIFTLARSLCARLGDLKIQPINFPNDDILHKRIPSITTDVPFIHSQVSLLIQCCIVVNRDGIGYTWVLVFWKRTWFKIYFSQ